MTDETGMGNCVVQVTDNAEAVPLAARDGVDGSSNTNVVDVLCMCGEDIGSAIDRLDSTISSYLSSSGGIGSEEILFGIGIAVIGAFSAFIFNFLHWQVVSRRENVSRIGAALESVISDLEEIAIEYWLLDYSPNQQLVLRTREISIKSKIRLINRYVEIYLAGNQSRRLKSDLRKLKEFRSQVFDLATGDNFESKSRVASKPRATKIALACSEMKALVNSLDLKN